jgi:predicted ATP-dependent endonuclease of OLD family
MLNRLVIERFRGFTRLEVKLPKVLALMGPNSSGKTTALHAIRIACQAIWTAIAADNSFKIEKDLVVLNDFVIRDIAQLMHHSRLAGALRGSASGPRHRIRDNPGIRLGRPD